MRERILIVDDDKQITSFLERYLKKLEFEPVCVASGKEMREVLARQQIDLCVLDVGLPDADGFELTREIRRDSDLPVIVLSVRDETYDRILGLEFGADDYITKPFEPRELVARIRTVLRRTNVRHNGMSKRMDVPTIVEFGHWSMNVNARTLLDKISGGEACLTSMEFDILRALVEHPHIVLSRDQLLDQSHGPTTYVGDRAVDVHIMRLRKKIEPDATHPTYIKTVHGAGYCFTKDVTRCQKFKKIPSAQTAGE